MLNKAHNNKHNDIETEIADDEDDEVVVVEGEESLPSSQLYGSSGLMPLAQRHSYEPTVLWHFVCPLQ